MFQITLDIDSLDAALSLETDDELSLSVEGGYVGGSEREYRGSYYVRPAPTEQVLETSGKVMAHDVTIGAIPSNYGLITWDGSTLMVS